MGTATVITSDALTDLEDDVTELTTKLNGVIIQYNKVQEDMTINKDAIDDIKLKITNHKGKIDDLITDVTDHKSKIDTLITDVEDINDKISGSYTPATDDSNYGASTDSILLRLERLDIDFVNLDNNLKGHKAGNYTSTEVHNVGSPSGGRTLGGPDQLNGIDELGTPTTGTASGVSSGTADESDAATRDDSTSTAEHNIITASYSTGAEKVITIGTKGEVRGKRLARQTLNRLRK